MKLKDGQKLIFAGDSVTDMGRTRGEGNAPSEGLFDPLGKGYPHVVSGLMAACYPELTLRIVNAGNSGNNIRDLKKRWKSDVLDLHPDWLSILIGINDVWRQFDVPQMPETHVPLKEYEETLEELVSETVPLLPGGIILMTPFFIEPNPQDAMRARMDEYGKACKRVAERRKTLFVDLQAAFDRVLCFRYSGFITWDRVHPNIYGATVIAREFLRVLDFDFEHNT